MTITTVELLACPFCGNEPVLCDPHGAFSRLAAVYCEHCEIKGPLATSAEFAGEAWNTRTEPTLISNLVKENEMLRMALTELRPHFVYLAGKPQFPSAVDLLEAIDTALRSNLDKEEGDNGE